MGLFILEATSCLTLGSVDTIYHDLIYPWAACIGAPYSALPLHSWLHRSELSYCFSCQSLGDLLGSVPLGSVLLFLTLFKFFFPPSTHIDNSLSRYLGTCSLSDLQVTGCPPPLPLYNIFIRPLGNGLIPCYNTTFSLELLSMYSSDLWVMGCSSAII